MNTPDDAIQQPEDNRPPATAQPQIQTDARTREGVFVPPQCQPVSLVFSPNVPPGGGLVQGFVAVQGVAAADCSITITSLNTSIFTTQKIAMIKKGFTTVPVSAIYTPSGTPGVVYAYASNGPYSTPLVGIVLPQPPTVVEALAGTPVITSLTYPKITATGSVNGTVTINQDPGPNGLWVDVASNSDNFQILKSPVFIPSGQTSAPIPTYVTVLQTPYTAFVGASCPGGPYGPVPITVPTP